MEDRYENYEFRGFENYNIVEDRRNKWHYNQFGDRLTKMTRAGRIWHETHFDDGSTLIRPQKGYINSQEKTWGDRIGRDAIWLAKESTDDWAISVIGAEDLRVKLTPLTMSIPDMDGMKIDFQSANYQASFINSNPVSGYPGATGGAWYGDHQDLVLRCLQFRRKIGALTLGTTYANMYAVNKGREKGNNLNGTVSDYAATPLFYAVRVVDDSPQDGDGPIVQDVKLKVNGVYRPDILPMVILDDLRYDRITAVTNATQREYISRSPDQLTIYGDTPKYLDYLYLNDYKRGWNTKNVTDKYDLEAAKGYYRMIDPGDKPVQVNGTEYVVYIFDTASITDRVNRVEVEVTVANDYRIQISQIYTNKVEGGHDYKGENFSHYNAEYWQTMAQAEGNIKDGSNLRTISLDFGYEVANLIYGFDANFNYFGFKVNGEFVTNTHYYMFSDGVPGTGLPLTPPTDLTPREGHRFSQTDHAYYVTIEKDWSRFGFAGEYFKMGKFYRPYMNYYSKRFTMIKDNDDDDRYSDGKYVLQFGTGPKTATAFSDRDGVFPGNDLDHDGFPDNEKNDNGIPDYDEPFLMFDVDPDEYVFGDDFNNNTIPDHRENDIKYDTPYDLERKGHHLYVRFTPLHSVNLFAGSLRTGGVGLDNRTDDDYFKANIDYDVFTVGKIFAEYRYERIHDNIQDRYVVVSTKYGFRYDYESELYYDEVEYRNSRVQKFFLESRIRAIPSITLVNHVKFERNKQIEGTMYDNTFQPKDVISIFALVNKFAYTKQWGNWTFSPGVKFRLYKKDRSESINPLDHYMMRIPLVYLKYTISPQTNFTLGMQGFRGFEMQYRDYIQSHNDYKQINYILQVENKTDYFGFDVWGGFGFRLEEIMFDEEYRNFEEYKSSSLFVRMWVGY